MERPNRAHTDEPMTRLPAHGAIRLLVIDADGHVGRLIGDAEGIAGTPMLIDFVSDFDAGLRVLQSGVHDVCLLSDNLRDRSGLDLLQVVAHVSTAPPIIMITSCANPDLSARALDAGAAHLLDRMCTDDRSLTRAIRFVMEQHRLKREILAYAENLERANAELEREITDRHHAEVELERSNKDLEQFAYAASHDLQEPLRVVSNYLRLLEQRLGDGLNESCHEFLDFAVDGAQRMSRLIAELLEYSRITTRPGELEPTDCVTIVNEAIANLDSAIRESQATISWDELPTIPVDAAQIARLVQNLIGNAIKFRNGATPEIRIAAENDGHNWVFSISDNGIGIDPKFHDRIFGIFQRLHTREQYEGTGIGLALCRRIVERHGGQIWVESAAGQGSTFRFTIPVTSDTLQPVDTQHPLRR